MKIVIPFACVALFTLTACDSQKGGSGGGTQVDEAISNEDRSAAGGLEKRPGDANLPGTPTPTPTTP